MDDLIYRRDAIDQLHQAINLLEAEDRLSELPSAQPEPSQVARDIATIIENEKDMRVIASADPPMIKPICPFRVERIESHTKVDEFTDKFIPCMRKRCPCYIVEADTEWCYREYLMFPLNEKAREIVDDFNNHKIY